jgi:hypothetical protein
MLYTVMCGIVVAGGAAAVLGLMTAETMPLGPIRQQVVRASVWTLLVMFTLAMFVVVWMAMTGVLWPVFHR